MKTKLITTIHDFGLTHSVNEGIFYALKNKNADIITNLSILPNTSGSLEAATFLKDNPNISATLCFALTTGRPISQNVSSMIDDDGNFLRANTKVWDFSIIDKYSDEDIRTELEAQYKWFLDNVGRRPDGITTQKNEHGDPKVLKPFLEIAKREDLVIQVPLWKWSSNYAARSYAQSMKITSTSNAVVGVYDWKGRFGYDLENDLDRLILDLSKVDGVSELILFCGFVDKELFDISSVSWQRGQIFNVLNNDSLCQKIRESFDLVSYRDFPRE